jgi:hypothetical protein
VSASLRALIPELQEPAQSLLDAAGAAGLVPRITSTFRSGAEQGRLYRRYLQGLQPLPVAPPGHSAHEFGYAFDMVVSPMDALSDVGAYWQDMGGVWGGAFNDPVHFEYPGFKDYGPAQTLSLGLDVWQMYHNLPWYVQILIPGGLLANLTEAGLDYWLTSIGYLH